MLDGPAQVECRNSVMPPRISSLQNPKIKEIARYRKRGYRDQRRMTVVEGCRELGHALDAGITPDSVFICNELVDGTCTLLLDRLHEMAANRATALLEVTPEVFAKIAYRETTGGILAVIPYVNIELGHMPVTHDSLYLIVETPEKPGNLGALLRTADAAGFDAVIVCGQGTDLHNPNVIRASLGAVFTVPVCTATTVDTIAWTKTNGYQSIAATPYAEHDYYRIQMQDRTAIVVGSEADGLSDDWLSKASVRVRIPMYGRVDSLNLSTSAAILMYEAVRQRNSRWTCVPLM